MTSRRTLIFFILIFLTYFTVQYAGSDIQAATSEITDISVQAVDGTTEIQISTSAPLSYTVYKPADPYRVVVELQEVGLGRFRDKIVVDRAGVMEIIPSTTGGTVKNARLEIILTVPADVEPTQQGDLLVLAFSNPEAGTASSASYMDAGTVEKVELRRYTDRALVVITGDGRMYPEVFELDGNKVVVDIPDVSSSAEAPTTFAPPVMGVRVNEQADRTRVVIDVADSAGHDMSTEGNQVILTFKAAAAKTPASAPPAEQKMRAFATKEYTGEKISIDFQDADLIHIFRLIADVSGYNIVVSPAVSGKFSMKLDNIPWDQALDIILRNYNLSKRVEDKIIRVAPTKDIVREEETIARMKESALKAGDLVTKIYPIDYADVDDVKSAIEDASVMTDRGFIGTDERTSSILIKDVEEKQPEYEKIIAALDKATPQVSIEARIVEVSTNFVKDLGIQWGVLWQPTPQSVVGGVNGLSGGNGFFGNNPMLVNLPAAVGAGAGGSLGFGYISAKELRNLDIQLSAMESTGNGRIVSNPRIVTMDNQEATISQGKKIPYQTFSQDKGLSTEFVDAKLELVVTPHITPRGTIVMDIKTTKNEADFAQTVGEGVPTIDTKEATTQVLVDNGDTLVMGGIFKTNISKSVNAVPLLSKIPVIGWLFKKEKEIRDTTELLIFITPKIIPVRERAKKY
ncbi:type IV pilus biogenesis and competence protein PilQ precursor [bacterium BMS3Bbin08]|nr:type IV pilus biogenesis and competence protein PilQ precursor [bacterium BMS3Bbin08]